MRVQQQIFDLSTFKIINETVQPLLDKIGLHSRPNKSFKSFISYSTACTAVHRHCLRHHSKLDQARDVHRWLNFVNELSIRTEGRIFTKLRLGPNFTFHFVSHDKERPNLLPSFVFRCLRRGSMPGTSCTIGCLRYGRTERNGDGRAGGRIFQ